MSRTSLTLKTLALLFRSLSLMARLWPIALIAWLVLSPVGPHLRWQYSAYGPEQARTYTRCVYLGPRGFVAARIQPDCPLFALLNAETGRAP